MRLKKRQARREERGLVEPNKRRTTQPDAFSGQTLEGAVRFWAECQHALV
ncbi:MAG: hypothetical protein HQL69_16110 [Magnetococcales bacterium]|nr:hypothetical protein [Magnetococcales bacterium]